MTGPTDSTDGDDGDDGDGDPSRTFAVVVTLDPGRSQEVAEEVARDISALHPDSAVAVVRILSSPPIPESDGYARHGGPAGNMLAHHIPEPVRRVFEANAARYQRMSDLDSEKHKLETWLDVARGVPFGRFLPPCLPRDAPAEELRAHFDRVKRHMDEVVAGHEETKREILLLAAQWISAGGGVGKVLGIQGPPGIGKTRLITSLGRALFGFGYDEERIRPVQVVCAGSAGEGFLDGFQYTFSGSAPGEILKSIVRAGVMNPIICIDEVDKMDQRGDREASAHAPATAALIHAFDPVTNARWRDKFLGVEIDVSRVTFLCSFNSEDAVSPILLDRMHVVRMRGYTVAEKVAIAEGHLVPRSAGLFGMDGARIDAEILREIAEASRTEEGVRGFIRMIERVLGEVNMWRLVTGDRGERFRRIDRALLQEVGVDPRRIVESGARGNACAPPPGMYT